MKPFLGIIGGFVVSLGMFCGGLATATFLITAEPDRQPGPSLEVADLWAAHPRKVDKNAQNFERIPALPVPSDPAPSAKAPKAATGPLATADPQDTVTTGSVPGAASEEREQLIESDQLQTAHVEWCTNRYRSYRPENNRYTRYDGEQWPCVSPYTRQRAAAELPWPAPSEAESYAAIEDHPWSPLVQYAVDETGTHVSSDHVSYCFSRYRSYRPEDNTYQPYGGGPRRQCR